jgi:vitamin B12 transporter
MGSALFAVLLSVATAAGSPEEPAYRLEEIVVTAGRLPYHLSEAPFSVAVLGGARLRLSVAADPADLLRQLGTVRVSRYGGLGAEAGLHMGSMSSVHTLVLLDGRPVNSPDVGTADLGQIWLEGIGKVEALSGAASSLYGPGALSGVVNFISKPASPRWDLTPQFRLGTWQTARAALRASGPLGRFRASGGGAAVTTRGHRPNSAHTSRDAKLQLQDEHVALRAGWHEEDSGSPGPRPPADVRLWTPTQQFLGNDQASSLVDRLHKQSGYVDIGVTAGLARLNAYWQRWKRAFDQQYMEQLWGAEPAYARHVVDADHESGQMAAELRGDFVRGTTFLSGSVWLSREYYEAETTDANTVAGETSIAGIDAERAAPAVLLHGGTAAGVFTFDAGLRWDNPSDLRWQVSPRGAVGAVLGGGVRARVSAGRGYRPPTLADLHWPSDPWAQGNPDLEVEESWTVEGGIGTSLDAVTVDVSYQYRDVSDLIQWAPTGPPNDWGTPIWQPSNVSEVRSHTITTRLGIAGCWGALDAAYSLSRAKRTDDEIVNAFTYATERRERRAPFQPEHRMTVRWDLPRWRGFELGVSSELASDVVNYYTNWDSLDYETGAVGTVEKRLASYGTLDAELSKLLGNSRLYVEAVNLFDARYATQFGDLRDRDYPMPGRSLTVGLEVGLLP